MPWFRVVVLCALGSWFAWASTTPGGPSARVNGFIDHVRGRVEDATADPDLRRAAEALDAAYAHDGHYPDLNAEQTRDDPTFGLSVGVDATNCGTRGVVLVALTASGTVSRLLRDGVMVGDAAGRQTCPADLDHPAPWKH